MFARFVYVSIAVLSIVAVPCRVDGQFDGGMVPGLSAGPVSQAVAGEPFGVLSFSLPVTPESLSVDARIIVDSSNERVFYPAVTIESVEVPVASPQPAGRGIGRPGGLIDRLRTTIRGEPETRTVPVAVKVHALFRGDQAIELRLSGDVQRTVRIQPIPRGVATPQVQQMERELLSHWWDAYVLQSREAIQGDDAPKLIPKYLTSMLAERMQLPAVDLDPPDPEATESWQPFKTLSVLAGSDRSREAIFEEVLAKPGQLLEADQPLPQPPRWTSSQLPAAAPEVVIETLATQVPPECFYVRFGAFSNYVWFQEISQRYGGNIGQAVLLRGFDYQSSVRMERMLASKLTTIAKMFGDKLVNDMALIGTDLYMKEGASLGVLFHCSNPDLFSASVESDRKAVLAKNADAKLETVEINNQSVSLLSTPDNRIRSFFVRADDYVLITTSRTLARRFLEVHHDGRSLAQTPEYRWARAWMPESNNYSLFAYFSPDFFHHLVSPAVQIELRRRMEAIAHIEIAEIARMAAQAEGVEAESIEQLQSAGFLPAWFDVRADRSRIVRMNDKWLDSTRGARGSFLPIADVEVTSVTEQEAVIYQQSAEFYERQWQTMDPLLVGVRRFKRDDAPGERVAFECYLAPFQADKYGWIAQQLGAPSNIVMSLPNDDVLSLQLRMAGNRSRGESDYHLFGGVKDMLPPAPEEVQGLLKWLKLLRSSPAYIGAWPKPDLIEKLPLGIGLARPDLAGYSRMIGGLWRWQNQEMSILSFNRQILDTAVANVSAGTGDDTAQARLMIADLNNSQLSEWVDRQWYVRGMRSSKGNVRLLDTMQQQLKVPDEKCLESAERLLDVKLQCPVGGKYEYQSFTSGSGWWISTAWKDASVGADGKLTPPDSYTAPWIEWFRGARVHLTQGDNSLAAVGTLDLDMPPLRVDFEAQEPTVLPPLNFDLFHLPLKLFGESDAVAPQVESERKSF